MGGKSKSSSSSQTSTTNRDSRALSDGSGIAIGGDDSVGARDGSQVLQASGNIYNDFSPGVERTLAQGFDLIQAVIGGASEVVENQSERNLDAIQEIQSGQSERFAREVGPLILAGVAAFAIVKVWGKK